MKQSDARVAAVEEIQRSKEEEEERSREIKERHEKAVLRHKYAREKELLRQDYDHLLNELGHLEQMDRRRRQAVVASIPKQVFQPPHKRLEDRLQHQQNLEEAFEDMYMAKTDFAGDLTLALDPQPPSSDHDLDLTTESTIDTDILQPSGMPPQRNAPVGSIPISEEDYPEKVMTSSEETTSPQSAGLVTRGLVQFPIGVDSQLEEDSSSALTEDKHTGEALPTKKILPRSEALGRLLLRIRGQKKETSSQNEISTSTMATTSSSSQPSDLSQYPIDDSKQSSVPASTDPISKQPADISVGSSNQNEEDKSEPCPDEQEEPILSGSPTLLHPLEKAALIRAKVDLQKHTEEQEVLYAKSQRRLMELRKQHQEIGSVPSKEPMIKDHTLNNSPCKEAEDVEEATQKIQHQYPERRKFQVHPYEVMSWREEPNTSSISTTHPQSNIEITSVTRSSSERDDPALQRIRQYQQHLLQQHRRKKEDINSVQKQLKLTTEQLFEQQKHMSSVPQSYPMSSVPQSYPMSSVPPSYPMSSVPPSYPMSSVPPSYPMSSVPPSYPMSSVPPSYLMSSVPQLDTESSVPKSYTESLEPHSYALSTDDHTISSAPDISHSELVMTTNSKIEHDISAATSDANKHETSLPTDTYYNTKIPSSTHQPISLRDQSETYFPTKDQTHRYQTVSSHTNLKAPITQYPHIKDEERITEFYKEHEIRIKWLREQQELMQKQRETLFKHQEMQKRSLEEKQMQLKCHLRGEHLPTVDATENMSDSEVQITRQKSISPRSFSPATRTSPITFNKLYPEFIQQKELLHLKKDIVNEDIHSVLEPDVDRPSVTPDVDRPSVTPDVDRPSVTPDVDKLPFNEHGVLYDDREHVPYQTTVRQRTYPPVSIPKVIPVDVKLNGHELSTIHEMESPKNQSHSVFQDELSSLQFKSLTAEEISENNTSDTQDESDWKTNDVHSHFDMVKHPTVESYNMKMYSPEVKSNNGYTSKVSPKAIINISNPVIEEDFPVSDREKIDFRGVGQEIEDLPQFKPHEFQSSTQNSESLESSIPPSVVSATKTSFTKGPIWKDILTHPTPKLKQSFLEDNPVQDQRSTYVSTFHSTEASRENISNPEIRNSNKTALSEYTIDKRGSRGSISQYSTLSEYPDKSQDRELVNTSSLISQTLSEYMNRYSQKVPRSEDKRDISDTNEQLRLPNLLDLTSASKDTSVTADMSSYSLVNKSPVLFHRLQAELTANATLSTHSLDTSKDSFTIPKDSEHAKTSVSPALSDYSIEPVKVTDEFDLGEIRHKVKQSGNESQLVPLPLYVSGTSSKPDISLPGEYSFHLPKQEFDSVSQHDGITMSRASTNSTSSSINRNKTNVTDALNDDFEHLFNRLSLKSGDVSASQDDNNVLNQVHSRELDTNDDSQTISNQKNINDQSSNKDDLKRMLQAVMSRRTLHSQGLQMFSDVSFSQHSLSSEGPSFLSRDLSQLVSSRTLSGLGQVSEEERVDLPSGTMPTFVRKRSSSKSQSSVSDDPEKLNSDRYTSKVVGYGGSSTESSESEQVDRLIQMIEKSKQIREQDYYQKQKLEQINEAEKKTEKELTEPLPKEKEKSNGIMEEPDLTLVSIPDTTISEGPVSEASLSEGSFHNSLSESDIGTRLSEGQLSKSLFRSFDQVTAMSEGLISETSNQTLEGLSEGRIVDYSAMATLSQSLLNEEEFAPLEPLSEGRIIDDSTSASLSEGILTGDENQPLGRNYSLSEERIVETTANVCLSEGTLTENGSKHPHPQSEGRIIDNSAAATISEGTLTIIGRKPPERLSEGRITDNSVSGTLTMSEGALMANGRKNLEPLSEGRITDNSAASSMSEESLTANGRTHLEPLSEGRIMYYSAVEALSERSFTESLPFKRLSEAKGADFSASFDDISESLLSFQKHESEVATPFSQKVQKIHQDNVMTSSSFQSSDTSGAGQSSLSLQEAFARHKKKFIISSKTRQDKVIDREQHPPKTTVGKKLTKKKAMKKLNLDESSSPNENSSNSAGTNGRNKGTKTKKLSKKTLAPKKRKDSEKDKLQRNLRLYNQLEEVKTKKKEEERKKFYEENRKKMKAFHDKVQSHLKKRASQNKK
ncbi:uncharacterized protein [Antedon mediterranea]|uniref:uncharacterized protein n=1 Tax=Antedon mediterranea TaxID=105859 RepID=UPI003AF5CBFB